MYIGVLVGGLLLGAGWALAGFCPGTGLVALGAGRLDALFFVLGGLLGAGVFTWLFARFADTWLFNPLLGGNTALASAEQGLLLALALAVLMFGIAKVLPDRLR